MIIFLSTFNSADGFKEGLFHGPSRGNGIQSETPDLGATMKVKGTSDGVALNGTDGVSNTLDILEFTDGQSRPRVSGRRHMDKIGK